MPYDQRNNYLIEKYNFEEELLNEKMLGNNQGQIMVNFDEIEEIPGENSEQQEANSKVWKPLYDADYKLLFNQRIFPIDMLQGKKIGDYMIQFFDLFDIAMAPENVCIKDHGDGMCDSHTIQFQPPQKRGSQADSWVESKNELELNESSV
jgi:hypothetical protein